MYGNSSIMYSNISVDSTDSTITFAHHTDGIYFHNTHATTDATVKLNNHVSVLIPAGGTEYVCIPGDYTQFQVITASVTLAVFAVG
ncbi:MAG TPA: hypothetical protein DEQ25_07330 [Methylophaga sp.]|nr:hypothetical protein [Methylophaga sp.]